jgi:hypothetical protein
VWRDLETRPIGGAAPSAKARARELRESEERRAKRFASMATALSRPYAERAAECGTQWRVDAVCGTCGQVHPLPVGCGLRHWCRDCERRESRQRAKRLTKAIGAALRVETAAWRARGAPRHERPVPRLLTVGVRDTGDLAADRKAIRTAWNRHRAWQHAQLERATPFALTWEVTDGTHGRGHVHAHAVAILPRVDYDAWGREWARATRGAAERQGFDFSKRSGRSVQSAARYMAKYAAKGVATAALAPEIAARWIVSMRFQRSISVSHGWWGDDASETPCCAGEWDTGLTRMVTLGGSVSGQQAARDGPDRVRARGPGIARTRPRDSEEIGAILRDADAFAAYCARRDRRIAALGRAVASE